MSGNHFLKTDILASRNSFSSQWKPFSSIASDIFQDVLHPGQQKYIFQSKRKSIVFCLELFCPASGNQYLNYREAYLKLLSLLLATIFFDFSDIPANVSSFFVQQKRILQQILHSCQWRQIFCLLETVFFNLDNFFCQWRSNF